MLAYLMFSNRSYRYTLIALIFIVAISTATCSRQPRYPAAPQQGTDIVIDAASLETDVPRFFTYRYQDRNISFFVLKLPSGIASYLDACITCYPKRLGYQYREGYVRCRACDTDYSVYKLEKGMGGCYPIKIGGKVENGTYRIELAEIQKHAGKF